MRSQTSSTSLPRAALAALAMGAAASTAQQPIGTLYEATPSTASRGALQSLAGTLLGRFDHDDLRGFGMNTPGVHELTGIRVAIEDTDASTPDTFTLALYREDLARPGYPDLGNPHYQSGPIGLPPGTGPQRHLIDHSFPSPIAVPGGVDLFVGVGLQAAPLWPSDGLGPLCILGHPSRWPVFDAPGPAAIQHQGYALTHIPAFGQTVYVSTRQLGVELLTANPGGTATAITNQASYPASNAPPGVGGLLSALHPDARATPTNAGRADDIGQVFLAGGLPDGTQVMFNLDLGGFGPELRLADFLPGSRGVLCLKQATMLSYDLRTLVDGQASITITIPPVVRQVMAGLPLLHQAMAFDLVNRRVLSGPCTRQVF